VVYNADGGSARMDKKGRRKENVSFIPLNRICFLFRNVLNMKGESENEKKVKERNRKLNERKGVAATISFQLSLCIFVKFE
jgi:hypothetical protein